MRHAVPPFGINSDLRKLTETSPGDPTGPRFLVEDIYPRVDGGRFAVKRIAGEPVVVWADLLRDGHEVVAGALLWRNENNSEWHREPMRLHSNDRWHGSFTPPQPGHYLYAIESWTDRFGTWRKAFLLKREAGQDVAVELQEGRSILGELTAGTAAEQHLLKRARKDFDRNGNPDVLLDDDLAKALFQAEPRADLTRTTPLPLVAERERARAGAWYEMVPRSQGSVAGRHGTFDDCIARLPEIAAMGFDVLYFTPIHPIGRTNRKGRNNTLKAEPGDPGSPYAIGGAEGGHTAIHPELGTLDDFRRLVAACRSHGMEVALDFAIQCSLNHPWLTEHPDWFKRRPDGSIRYAENPPKKYEDIVNPDFSCDDRISLWTALRDVVLFWVDQGVRIFRVDNPHTKPFPFWEWLIREVTLHEHDTIFLSEAFTRPKIMKALAKLGFSQSYTYFTWREHKAELEAYLTELTRYPERDFFRPNFFVSTPDILPVHLQRGEPWAFKARFALAATLSSNYGIYNGFELLEHEPLPGKEEYANSEKYEIRVRDWNKPGNIKDYIARLNQIRRDNAALQQTSNLRFLQVDDPQVIGFLKEAVTGDNAVAVAIALTGDGPRQFWFHFGDIQIATPHGPRPVRAIENLKTGEQRILEWGGARLTIHPLQDPVLLFRCLV
jgi:starch synthase (maltosyl-transferring)